MDILGKKRRAVEPRRVVLGGKAKTKTPADRVRVAIRLSDPPAEDLSEDVNDLRRRRRVEQTAVAARIAERIGEPLEVVWNITRTANVIAANVRRKDIPLIETVEGVVSVAVETEHQLQGDHGTGADKPSITK